MNDVMRVIAAGFLCSASLMLTACGSSDTTGSAPITVAGTVTGLISGASVEVTSNDGTPPLTVTANGNYTFSAVLETGASYDITIAVQPAGENCTVSNGTGTVGTTTVGNILIACTADRYAIFGSLTGLMSGRSVVVQDNGTDSTTVSANGNFSFAVPVPSGTNYAVTILTQPAGQSCAVTNGSGTVGAANVSNVSISCSDNTYNVGVTVSGVNASGLRLADNGADILSVLANGNFNFNTPVASGLGYAVTIASQPLGENCSVVNGSGTIVSSNVSVTVSCVPQAFPISGTLAGLLSGQILVLQDNGANSTTVSANGQFSFSSPVASGSSYSVTVFTEPAGQSCAVSNGSGTVMGSAVSNVSVACSDNTYNIGVTVSGVIRSGLVLENNGADNLPVSANGSFNFATPLPSGAPYAVTLLAQPAGETCAVSSGSGTVAAANVTGIPVQCTPLYYSVSGALTGLLPSNSLVVEDNGGNATTLSANGNFSIAGQIASGSAYTVTVSTQPPGQSCAVANGSGTIVSSNATTVAIACSDNTYNIGVTVSGLVSGTSLVLQDNGGDNLTVAANGTSNFSTPIASGSVYLVALLTPPLGEICTLTNASATVGSSNVNVTVSCTPNPYTISGAVSGLQSGNSVILEDNGANATTVSANTGFSFTTPVLSGSAYSVTVSTQPPGQTCSVSNGSATVQGANVTNVTVGCSDNTYDIGVTVSGLTASGLVLQDNGGDNLTISANGSMNFATPIPSGSAYAVSVLSQPTGETCTVSSGSGIVTSSDVSGIPVSCVPSYTIGGTVSGLSSGSLVLQDNGGDNLTLSANGGFTFATPVVDTGAYAVTILTQPSGHTCIVGNGSGSVSAANVTTVTVTCGNYWTWVSGSATAGASGVYGTQGVASTSNVPGARYSPVTWTDASGNLWLFGGVSLDGGFINDLWEFNPTAKTWEWVSGSMSSGAIGVYGTQGVAAAGNVPGSREAAVSWTDASGNLWLFGGYGLDSAGATGYMNDLWAFNITAGTWEWVSGSTTINASGSRGSLGVASTGNVPGARYADISWTDASGNLWLFGGYGFASSLSYGALNDLWEFNPTAGTWEWISGSNAADAIGVYGTLGVASTSNVPGARQHAISWSDASGNQWLFGGQGYDSSGLNLYLNDLWKFDSTAGTWEWVSGSSTGGGSGLYGTQGVASTNNLPGAREGDISWTDATGNLWLFGGYGLDSAGNTQFLNDLWKFNPSTGAWEWLDGSHTGDTYGVYGTQGVASTSNDPGSRYLPIPWTDASGNLWLFGGSGYAASGGGYLNDLWEYVP